MTASRIELHGVPRLIGPGGQARLLERHDAALLALVVVDGRLTRARAASLLWPHSAGDRALNNLRQRLFGLKRLAGRPLVSADRAQLALAEGIGHDHGDLAALLAADPAAAARELLEGVGVDGLPEFSAWLDAARARWCAQRADILGRLADRFEGAGDVAAALPYARRLASEEPADESAHRRLMRLHYRLGDRAAALAAYRRGCDSLQSELGALPDAQTVELLRLIERSAVPTTAVDAHAAHLTAQVALRRPPRLIGRDAEWAHVQRGWQEGRVALLRGEPGVGKSRLAGDLALTRQQALVGRSRPGDATLPYALLARLMRSGREIAGDPPEDWVREQLSVLVPEFGALRPGAADALRLRQAVAQALTGWVAQGVSAVVVDDLQFADSASLEALLGWLAEPPQDVACLVTVRAGEVPGALAAWLDSEGRERAVVVELGPLDLQGLIALLDSLELPGVDAARQAPALLRHTGGNPLFVLETLISMLGQPDSAATGSGLAALPAPTQVTRAIEQRMAALPEPALRLVRVAAIAGVDFDAELAAAVLGCPAADLSAPWAQLEAAQVLRDGAFAHDLIFEAAQRLVPAAVARLIHHDVARELERREWPAARVAHHWWQAEAWAQAGRQLDRAADAAAAQARHDDELAMRERAAAAYDQAGDAARAFAARLRAVDALIIVGSVAAARERLATLDTQCSDDAQHLAVLLSQATAALTCYDAAAGEAAARAAYDLARSIGDEAATIDAARMLGSALALQGRAGAALSLLESHATRVDGDPSWRRRCEYLGTYAYALQMANRRRDAVHRFREAARLAEQQGDLAEALTLLTNAGGTLAQLGQPGEALALLEHARRLRLRMGRAEGIGVISSDNVLGLTYGTLGRYAEAMQVFDASLQRARAAGAAAWVVVCESLLANLYLVLGQTARAHQVLSPVPDATPVGQRARRLVVEARCDQAQGGSGLQWLRQAAQLVQGHPLAQERLGVELMLAARLQGSEGLALCRAVREAAAAHELEAIATTATAFEVDQLRRSGFAADAGATASALIVRVDHCAPFDLYAGEFWWILVQALDAAQRADEALMALQRGATWVRAALAHVPESFRDSFLHRQPVNLALMAAARRRLDPKVLGLPT